MSPPNVNPTAPTGNGPVVPDRKTADRWSASAKYVESMVRGRDVVGRGPRTDFSPAKYAFLAASGSITGASGGTLGSGTVTLCSRNGAALTADGESVTAYNAGGSISGGASGVFLQVGWADGDWSVTVAPCS